MQISGCGRHARVVGFVELGAEHASMQHLQTGEVCSYGKFGWWGYVHLNRHGVLVEQTISGFFFRASLL